MKSVRGEVVLIVSFNNHPETLEQLDTNAV